MSCDAKYKRLSTGKFRWWPAGTEASRTLAAHELPVILAAGNPEATQAWRPIGPAC
jgi:transposase